MAGHNKVEKAPRQSDTMAWLFSRRDRKVDSGCQIALRRYGVVVKQRQRLDAHPQGTDTFPPGGMGSATRYEGMTQEPAGLLSIAKADQAIDQETTRPFQDAGT